MFFRARFKNGCRWPIFLLMMAAYFTLVINFPLTVKSYTYFKQEAALSIVTHLGLLQLSLFCLFISLFSLLSVKYFEKPIFIGLTLLSSILSYVYFYYGFLFEKSASFIGTLLQANWQEISLFITPSFILYFILFGLIPSFVIYKIEIIQPPFLQKLAMKSLGIMIYPIFYFMTWMPLSPTFQPLLSWSGLAGKFSYQIIPTNFFENVYNYHYDLISFHHVHRKIGLDAKNTGKTLNGRKNLLVFIVGESARSMNFELNGYPRDTNQYTKKQNVISFRHFSTCDTCTRAAVPCIFSAFNKAQFFNFIADHQDNLLDILKRAGINVLWLDNNGNGDCQGVCKRIESVKMDSPYDESLVIELQKRIDRFPNQDTVIILHLRGSHGVDYYAKYPPAFQTFTPECRSNEIRSCDRAALVNAYDNSILYTDYVLSRIITELKKRNANWNTALIYTSDHGESLGENAFYEHCAPSVIAPAEQTNVPFIFWASDTFIHEKQLSTACLQNKTNQKDFSHDNIFHSVLGLMDISTVAYQHQLDLFHSCRL